MVKGIILIELICPVCKRSYTRKQQHVNRNKKLDRINVCSRSCANFARRKPKKQHYCKMCGSEMRQGKYRNCEDCREINKNKTLSYTVSQIRDAYKSKSGLAFAAKIRGYSKTIYDRSDQPKCCIVCGYNKHYEVCHIRPVKTFDDSATMAEVHSLDNLIALCPNCHWEFDHGLITLS